jgi:hypothetical protein
MWSSGSKSKTYAIGVEVGFMVMENLWLSGGYNWQGFRDDELTSGEYTQKGVYVRLRYKFDEDLFGKAKSERDGPKADLRPGANDKPTAEIGSAAP